MVEPATRPSAIIAQYLDGQLTRDRAAQAFETAEWDRTYVPASYEDNIDGALDELPPESFVATVGTAHLNGEINDTDYAAFAAAADAARRTQAPST